MLDEDFFVGHLATREEEKKLQEEDSGEDLTAFRNELPTFSAMTVDTDADKDFQKYKFLDLKKPLMPQILLAHWTKEFYLDLVNRPRHSVKGAMVYPHPVLDVVFSQVPWWAIIVYAPVPYAGMRVALNELPKGEAYKLFALGFALWLFVEYIMHRFLFHMDNSMPDYNQYIFAVHFAAHGVHHFLPMDPNRIAAPWVMVVTVGFLVWRLLLATSGYDSGNAIFAGSIAGFIVYEEFHISLHTMPQFYQFWSGTAHYLEMKRYHLQHHYKNYEIGYGVTQKIWDYVFRTVLDPEDESQVHRNAKLQGGKS
ncbi:hypothetical protein BABINDRAFT_34905 [Babjeviella inositovora NRRL Y-12698]|uniref:Fatty acid hydroxylase domain-containing protein n=1 Tax=Babjeviella inositovora NRRL Y-12698 TaxID=984486 RepID=A0A1E3QSP8_9ASCO|nr:uncharacterized protein BABINDRAFT_34905 [Babjeviella inositovora NRRL Y-12698]ODQ80735.1 hypothetical protein BABINDRAFT_34905 [Babjeviella inositovora NRRL Y-12698]